MIARALVALLVSAVALAQTVPAAPQMLMIGRGGSSAGGEAAFCANSDIISFSGNHYPDETCTGWEPTGVTLTPYEGPTTISVDGTTIDSADITDCLVIAADNVTIKRSRIICGGDLGSTGPVIQQYVAGGADDLLLEDVEIFCSDSTTPTNEMAVTRGLDSERNFTMRRANVRGCVDQVWAENTPCIGDLLIEDSYFHDPLAYPGNPPDPHIDLIQIPSNGCNITVRRNTILAEGGGEEHDSSAGLTAGSGLINVLIQDNVYAGGTISLRVAENDAANTTTQVLDNLFWDIFGYYGLVDAYAIGSGVNEHSGSVDFETGMAL